MIQGGVKEIEGCCEYIARRCGSKRSLGSDYGPASEECEVSALVVVNGGETEVNPPRRRATNSR